MYLPMPGSGVWNADGLLTHSARDFWNRRTCNGLVAMPTSAIISRNSSSPASHNCWTSSPPACLKWNFPLTTPLACQLRCPNTYPSPVMCHNTSKGLLSAIRDTVEVQPHWTALRLSPLWEENSKIGSNQIFSHTPKWNKKTLHFFRFQPCQYNNNKKV